jgi:hypothetical protein
MHGNPNRIPRIPFAAATLALAAALSGCAGNSASTSSSAAGNESARLTGKVYGGQQPVGGALIQLYSVGTTGTGSASAPLLSSTVTTGAQGQFSVPNFSCASATQVYLTATGGSAGAGTNSAIAMMASLGDCSTLQANSATTFININELTTVAAVYALAPFMNDYTHTGAQGSDPTGLVNAFTTSGALVSTAAGQIAATPAGITLPAARLNTLADILAACINTSGASSAQCTTLFSATGATETIGAALAIAKNPGAAANVALWSLPSGTPPFLPGLTAQPNDFTLAIKYAGAELQSPYGIAVDAAGNAWVTNEAGSSVVKLPHPTAGFAATAFTANGSLLAPRGVSIDRGGNVWIANTGGNNVVALTGLGAPLAGSPYAGGGLMTPVAIANDSTGNAWVANLAGNSVSEFSRAGAPVGASPFTGSGAVAAPTSVAIDSGSGALCILSNAAVLQSCNNDGSLFGATGVAVNGSTVAMSGSVTGAQVAGAFTLASSTGATNSASPVSGGGLALPAAVAFDGSGKAWFANASSISVFAGSTAISPATGFTGLSGPAGIAIDPSGNVWTANAGDNSVSIFVGLGTPVATPLAVVSGP